MRNAYRADETPGAGGAAAVAGRVTRRHVLLGAAAVGVGGAVVGATSLSEAFDTAQPAAGDARDIVVHVRDVRAGRLDVFAGDRRVEIRDRDLAARLAKAARAA